MNGHRVVVNMVEGIPAHVMSDLDQQTRADEWAKLSEAARASFVANPPAVAAAAAGAGIGVTPQPTRQDAEELITMGAIKKILDRDAALKDKVEFMVEVADCKPENPALVFKLLGVDNGALKAGETVFKLLLALIGRRGVSLRASVELHT